MLCSKPLVSGSPGGSQCKKQLRNTETLQKIHELFIIQSSSSNFLKNLSFVKQEFIQDT